MIFRIPGSGFYLLGEVNEFFILDSGTTGTTDQIEFVFIKIHDGSNPSVGDIRQYLASRGNFLMFVFMRKGKGNPNRIADARFMAAIMPLMESPTLME